jgi:hypothetical protein
MTVIELPDEQAAKLKAQAEARGLTIVELIDTLTGDSALKPGNQPVDKRHISEVIVDNMKDVPPEIMATMPKDGASEHDHYIYGWPKREA